MPSNIHERVTLIVKNTLMLYIRMIIVAGVGLFTSRIVLEQLGVIDYGIYNVVGGVITLFSFLNGAMAQSTQRFLSFELEQNNPRKVREIFKASLTVHIAIGLIILILAETVGVWFLNNKMVIPAGQMESARRVFQCVVISLFINILSISYNSAIIAREKMQIYAYISILDVCIKLGIAYSLSNFAGNKLQFYAVLLLLSNVLVSAIYIVYCKRNFSECAGFGLSFNKENLRSLAGFISWTAFGSLAWVSRQQGYNVLLNLFFGPVVNAAYGISNQVNNVIGNFVRNYTTALNPQIVKNYSAGEYVDMNRLVMYGSKIAFLLLFLISFPILLCTSQVLHLWLVDVPEYAVIFTRLFIVNSLIESFTHSMGISIIATGKIRVYQIVVGGILLLNIPLGYILLKSGTMPPILFVVMIFLTFTAMVIRLIIMRKLIPGFSIRKFVNTTFRPSIIISAIAAIIFIAVNYYGVADGLNIFITLGLSFIIIFFLEYYIALGHNEREQLCNFFRRIIAK
ncbi:MAG: lipopolysaccharide biosynthesis protein [Bacteroidales bacterium]|nr:lipopolysaccharide biosynthesis protein [Bacteroidales bacterium]